MTDICSVLHHRFNELTKYNFPFDISQIPTNGIYILFEDGERAHDTNRIVRIGTHTGKDQLRSRLVQHFLKENKDRSIFRKNIGRAILNKENDPFLAQWEIDLTTREARIEFGNAIDPSKLAEIEHRVSEYIRSHFCFVVFPVLEKQDRLKWESRIISTVSKCEYCNPSTNWLGSYSPKKKIQESGLWLVNELHQQHLSKSEMSELLRLLE
ncbi:MAG: hypothetical protein AB9897_05895 [Anaerolineaceae bacterium]